MIIIDATSDIYQHLSTLDSKARFQCQKAVADQTLHCPQDAVGVKIELFFSASFRNQGVVRQWQQNLIKNFLISLNGIKLRREIIIIKGSIQSLTTTDLFLFLGGALFYRAPHILSRLERSEINLRLFLNPPLHMPRAPEINDPVLKPNA